MHLRIFLISIIAFYLLSCTNESTQLNENDVVFNLENMSETDRDTFHQNIHNDIVNELTLYKFDGKSAKQVINDHLIKRSIEKDLKQFSDPVRLIRQNIDQFSDFFGPEDLVLYDDILSLKIDSLFNKNDAFRLQLIEQQINVFEDKLSTVENGYIFNSQINPTNYAKAYFIYEKSGFEALIDYVNYNQFYFEGSPTQDPRVDRAMRRFAMNPQYRDDSPFVYAEKQLINNH